MTTKLLSLADQVEGEVESPSGPKVEARLHHNPTIGFILHPRGPPPAPSGVPPSLKVPTSDDPPAYYVKHQGVLEGAQGRQWFPRSVLLGFGDFVIMAQAIVASFSR